VSSESLKVLILEDDETVGQALKEALTRAGHQVFLATRPDEARVIFQTEPQVKLLFCDCLLPQMTGIDFIAQLRANTAISPFKVVLMSGIYTDRQFVQEAVQGAGAIAFLKKPFEMEQVLKIVRQASEPKSAQIDPRKMLYQLFSSPKGESERHKKRIIESLEELSGFDLPFLFSFLSGAKSSGYLNIYNMDGSVSGVSFSNGYIVGVDVDDKGTLLGEMLIQSGYATPISVQEALKSKNAVRIGFYLINNNFLSPHAFDLMLMEQMNIRLVRKIVEDKIRINFVFSEVEKTSPNIDPETLTEYIHDWIASKVSLSWIKAFFVLWSESLIVKGPLFREDHSVFEMPLVKALEGFKGKINDGLSLLELLSVEGYDEVAVYKALYFLLTTGVFSFAAGDMSERPQDQALILQNIWKQIQGKNNFEVLEFLKISMQGKGLDLGPNNYIKLTGQRPDENQTVVLDLWTKVKGRLEEVVRDSRNFSNTEKSKMACQKSASEAKLQASGLVENAKKALYLNQYAKAMEHLSLAASLGVQVQHLNICLTWAKLGLADATKKQVSIREIELELSQVPPEERYDTLFSFVMGIFSKAKGDFVLARKSFEKSIALDSTFIPARRELSLLDSNKPQKQDVFNMDLKQVVSGFFKKR
jgi:CheY-like chemotaxis protein